MFLSFINHILSFMISLSSVCCLLSHICLLSIVFYLCVLIVISIYLFFSSYHLLTPVCTYSFIIHFSSSIFHLSLAICLLSFFISFNFFVENVPTVDDESINNPMHSIHNIFEIWKICLKWNFQSYILAPAIW